jgi:hypothetical protein
VSRVFFPLDEQLKLWEKHWSEQVAKQAVWLSGLVSYAQAAEILQKEGQIGISGSSVWRRVKKWGAKIQAVEARQQVKAYELEEPKPHDPNRSRGKMGVSLDGTRREGWKELKVGCVYQIGTRLERDPQTQEEMPLGCACDHT